MATYTLVDQANIELASLVALALNTRGVPVLHEFWAIPEGTHQLYLAIVTPLVDQIGLREAYKRTFDALDGETFLTKEFVSSQVIVLGESQARPITDRIQAGAVWVAQVGPHDNAEVFPVPSASSIQKSGFLHVLPVPGSGSSAFPCRALFGAFGSGGFIKSRDIEDQAQLDELFQALDLRDQDREQIVDSLKHSRDSQTVIYNIRLDVLYGLGLV